MENSLFWIVPCSSVLALLLAWYFYRGMMKESEGTELMAKIASHVRRGAMSYLKQQYKIVGIVFVVLALI
ncbi:MAG: sodium/proton-translocating pyrophosphatase, partial [Paramuribaculum sp.]|nr:sodium/proton-translocating pyrophosphatase [Paramuribaculum sp.]